MYCIENKQVFNKIQVIMYIQLFENTGTGTTATNGQFFSQYVFKHLSIVQQFSNSYGNQTKV